MIVVLMISIISFRPDDQIEIKMPPAYTDLYASGTQTATVEKMSVQDPSLARRTIRTFFHDNYLTQLV